MNNSFSPKNSNRINIEEFIKSITDEDLKTLMINNFEKIILLGKNLDDSSLRENLLLEIQKTIEKKMQSIDNEN